MAKLKSLLEVAESTMAVRFEKPSNWTFKAGQFIGVTLTDPPETYPKGNTRGFGGMLSRFLRGNESAIYYVAGPPGMFSGLPTMLNHAGVDDDDICTEEFTGY